MKKTITILLMSLMTVFGVSNLPAADSDYVYKIKGTVDRLSLSSGEIVIGDMLFRVSPNMLVRDEQNEIAKAGELRLGRKVLANSYSGASYGSSDQYVHEIRMLPDNFDLESISLEDD